MAFESLRGKMDVALHALCSCIVFIFLITSTPISQFKGKGISKGGARKITCVTVWGLKNDCGQNDYEIRPKDLCDRPKQLFQATEAFYIISVVFALLSSILCGVYFMGMKIKIVLIILAVLNVACSLIPWALMTAVWKNDYCQPSGVLTGATYRVNELGLMTRIPIGKNLRDGFRTSAGYGLTIAAWCIQVVGFILLLAVSM